MTFQKEALVKLIILAIVFNGVATWTIDLPAVRRYLFEKNEQSKHYSKNEYEDFISRDQEFYSNIEGNSKHNSEDYNHKNDDHGNEKYEDEYGHYNYMEKKIHKIVHDGSSYLEGLRRALEDYTTFLENCNRRNSGRSNSSEPWRPPYDANSTSSPPPEGPQPPILNFQNYDNYDVPLRPSNEEGQPSLRRANRRITCQEAMDSSEQVRRYADLAMWATKKLQDLAYAKKYQKTDEQEENELILKLAWFLDRLAYLSGYEPNYKDYLDGPVTLRTPVTTLTVPTLVPSSDAMNRAMMDCLQQNSSEPATVRCRYNMTLPDLTRQMLDYAPSTTPSPSQPSSDSVIPMNSADSIPNQSTEILLTSANSPSSTTSRITKRSTEYTSYFIPTKPLHDVTYPVPMAKLIKHRLSYIKSVVKSFVGRRLEHIAEKKEEKEHFEKHFAKRSVDDSLQSSNSVNIVSNSKLGIKSIEKRPLDISAMLIHYPVSDVSVINTKSFKKRSIDERVTSNHINKLTNSKSSVKNVRYRPLIRKKFANLISFTKSPKRISKYPLVAKKSIQKRFTDDPFSKLANYYIKYKVWDNANPITQKKDFNKKSDNFDVKNHLKKPRKIHKRSLFSKKVIHLHVPKPIPITHVRHDPKHTLHETKVKILTQLRKLHDIKHKKLDKKIHKITKRSIKYEPMYLPRVPMDPQGDISYYIKNKFGTNYNPSLVQAGQVRLGLEQVFQTGNIEVVRRYGSNFNPLNPAPFYTGVLVSMADS